MISYSIITTRFKKHNRNLDPQNLHLFPPAKWDASMVCPLKLQPSEDEYNDYLGSRGVVRGDYVTFKHLNTLNGKERVHVVLDVIKPYAGVREWENGHPKCFRMMQLFPASSDWIRNDVAHAYRKITEDEYQKFVLPEIDFIRNRIQKHQFE
jgi:hypothetical protein